MSLLLKKILSFKEDSPLITVLDDSSQSSRPLIHQFLRNACQRWGLTWSALHTKRFSGRKVIYVGFEECQLNRVLLEEINIEFVKGTKPLDHLSMGQSPSSSSLRPMSSIIQDIKEILPAGIPGIYDQCLTFRSAEVDSRYWLHHSCFPWTSYGSYSFHWISSLTPTY